MRDRTLFRGLCNEMEDLLTNESLDADAFRMLEAQALSLLDGNFEVDFNILDAALFRSGSGPIAQRAHALASPAALALLTGSDNTPVPKDLIRHLPIDDIAWYISHGFARHVELGITPMLFEFDSPEMLALVAQATSRSEEEILAPLLLDSIKNMPRVPRLAEACANSLRHILRQPQGRQKLARLLGLSLFARDFRMVSALLSLGANITPDEPWTAWTDDPDFLRLCAHVPSHHGRMTLVAMEPRTAQIFAREDQGPFHGLTPAPATM